MASLSKNCKNILDKIAKIEFDIYGIYKKLIDLELKKYIDLNYEAEKKALVDKLRTLKVLEEEEFDYFLNHPLDLAAALELFGATEKDLLTFASADEEENRLIKQRIVGNLIIIAQTIEFYSAKGKEANEILYAISFDNFINSLRTRYVLNILSERNKQGTRVTITYLLRELLYKNIFLSITVEDNLISSSFETAKSGFEKEYDVQLNAALKNEMNTNILTLASINISEIGHSLSRSSTGYPAIEDILKFKTWLSYLPTQDVFNCERSIIQSTFYSEDIKHQLLINIDDVLKEKQKEASPTEFSM